MAWSDQLKIMRAMYPKKPLICSGTGRERNNFVPNSPLRWIPSKHVFGMEQAGVIELAFDHEAGCNDMYVLTERGKDEAALWATNTPYGKRRCPND